jgi:hypothetical protein
MSEDKKPRNMSIKGFLHKAKGQVNAREFLTTHKQFLLVNVCASAPVLSDMENGLILPRSKRFVALHSKLSLMERFPKLKR